MTDKERIEAIKRKQVFETGSKKEFIRTNDIIWLIVAYENCQEPEKSFELINGVTFYYDPQQTKIDQEILKELEEFSMDCDDNVYSFYIDDNLGIVIF